MVFKQGMFQIDPNMTPDQVANKRAMIAALLPKFGSAKYIGEGVGQLATGVMAGRQGRKLDEIEGKGTASANDLFSRIFGTANSAQSSDVQGPLTVLGMTPDASPPAPKGPEYTLGVDQLPQSPTTPGGYSMGAEVPQYIPDEVKNGIFAGESGGDYNALFGFSNRDGGKYSNVRLTDMTVDEALAFANPRGEYGNWVKGQVGRVATPMGAYQVVGTTLKAAKEGLGLTGNEKMTPEMQDMIGGWIYKTQGTGAWEGYKGPRDSYTPSANSAAPSGYGPAPAPTSAPSIPINELYMALQNPWLSTEQKGLITSMIQEQQQASDPLRQLELQKAQLELEQMQNPTAQPPEELTTRMLLAKEAGLEPGTPEFQTYLLTGELPDQAGSNVPAGFATLDMQAQAAGYAPGTPEYQEFMRNGGGSGAPAAFIALDLQAKAAGYQPGTPEYQEFMATRGAGAIAEAKARGETVGAAEAALPGASSMAALIDQQIQDLKNDPYLPNMLGPVDSRLPNVSSEAARVQGKIDQLQGGAFLQARQMLKGGGAITDFEGQKAEAAFVRMQTAQSVEDFSAALDEFNAAVQEGVKKLEAQAGNSGPAPSAPAPGTTVSITSDAEYDALPSGTMFKGPDGKVRRKP